MRSNIHARRLRALSKASACFVLAGLVSACSNDASRLDTMLTSSTAVTNNQHKIIHSGSALNQPYPGDVAATTRSGIAVAKPAVAAVAPAYSAAPLASPVSRSPLPLPLPVASAPSASLPSVPSTTTSNGIKVLARQSSPLPSIPSKVTSTAKAAAPIVLQPRRDQATQLRVLGSDNTSTGSVTPAAPVASPAIVQKPQGWKNSKGAWVTVKSGETLYNLSRRYGVPVSAIMNANNITDANAVAAGRRILIPTYNYANSAPVSAPDNHPITSVSRASRGFQGQARGKVTVPKARAAMPAPVPVVKTPQTANVSSSGTYVVKSGDTLGGIAYRHGTSSAAIRSANGLSGDTIRLGQKLVMPSGSKKVAKTQYDTTTTGSVPKVAPVVKAPKPAYKSPAETTTIAKRSKEAVNTPKKTSSSAFRWPAQGRLIKKFGERDGSGTNDGIDISVPLGTPVKASENGTVIYSGSELEDFGKLILVSHDGGWVSAYAHASSTLVRRGDKVRRGQVIAKSGRTGNATVPKLHFELRKNSNPVNPLKYLAR